MMTSVVACGNGRLSDGLYRGLASEARLVLVKVGSMSRIPHDDIRRGLEWVVRNRKRYDIRIVNVSCGGDYEASLPRRRPLAGRRSARRATGILVCAAVGNLGHLPGHPVLPPASAPSVLTVGGLDDQNRLAFAGYDMYHSSYGPTVDGLQKPEVIAPGIWVAAPILPGTPTAAQAQLLLRTSRARRDDELTAIIAGAPGRRRRARRRGRARAPADPPARRARSSGATTSSPAPTSTSTARASRRRSSRRIAAQMIEANPALTPQRDQAASSCAPRAASRASTSTGRAGASWTRAQGRAARGPRGQRTGPPRCPAASLSRRPRTAAPLVAARRSCALGRGTGAPAADRPEREPRRGRDPEPIPAASPEPSAATPSSARRASRAGIRTAREMLITTRFADTNQVHWVRSPGGDRRQMTFFPDRVRRRLVPAPDRRVLPLRADMGGRRVQRSSTATTCPRGAITLLTDGALAERARPLVPRGRPDRLRLDAAPQRQGPRPLRDRPAPARERPPARGGVDGGGWSALRLVSGRPPAPGVFRVPLRQRELPLARRRGHRRQRRCSRRGGRPRRWRTRRGASPPTARASTSRRTGTPSSMRLAHIDLATGTHTSWLADIPWDVEAFDLSPDGDATRLRHQRGRRERAAGNHAVGLTGIADNCQVQGDNPRLVPISSGATAIGCFRCHLLHASTGHWQHPGRYQYHRSRSGS